MWMILLGIRKARIWKIWHCEDERAGSVSMRLEIKAAGSRDGTPQHPQSAVVPSEAFHNAFRTFEAGLVFFSSTITSRPQISFAVSFVGSLSFKKGVPSRLSLAFHQKNGGSLSLVSGRRGIAGIHRFGRSD